MAKKRKQVRVKPWCWYCDREFDDEKVLIQHQRMKHFKCSICHRKLNSASGLVIHMAQLHKITMEKVPNALDGHDTPELEIFGVDGVPQDDLQRHIDGLPIVPYNKTKMILGDSSILPLLAAQKVSVASQLAESKNLIVQGGTLGPIGSSGIGPAGIVSPPATATASASASVTTAPASNTNVIVSPPSVTSAVSPALAQPALPAMPQYPPTAQNNYYANNSYYQQYYAQQYAAYYQQYYAQQAAYSSVTEQNSPVEDSASEPVEKSSENKESDNQESTLNPETDNAIAVDESNPLESEIDSSIVVPPIVDEVNNRVVPGMIFTVPCIGRSIEELRSRLKKYSKSK